MPYQLQKWCYGNVPFITFGYTQVTKNEKSQLLSLEICHKLYIIYLNIDLYILVSIYTQRISNDLVCAI